MAWVGTITNTGAVAIEQSILNGETININTVEVGTGYVDPEDMKSATALSNQIGYASIESQSLTSSGIKIITSILPFASPVIIKEVGVFGMVNNVSTLIALYQNDEGIKVPSISEFPDYSYTFSTIWDTDTIGEISIYSIPSTLVTQADLSSAASAKLDKYQGSSNVGKFLGIDVSGNVTPMALPDTSGVITDTRKGYAIIITGNKNDTIDVSNGDYVYVENSTISGITDGFYKATANVTHTIAFISSNLQAVEKGLGSEVKKASEQFDVEDITSQIQWKLGITITQGGVYKLGKLIVFQLYFKTSSRVSDGQVLAENLPHPAINAERYFLLGTVPMAYQGSSYFNYVSLNLTNDNKLKMNNTRTGIEGMSGYIAANTTLPLIGWYFSS